MWEGTRNYGTCDFRLQCVGTREVPARRNGALMILFFKLVRDLELIENTPPSYSKTTPKPEYHNQRASAFLDVPLFADDTEVTANNTDARLFDKQARRITF